MIQPAANQFIAYFSMEIGLADAIPTYSGGLGVLAGDTLRAAADLGLPMVAVTLLYRQGFFRQVLDSEGHQSEAELSWDPSSFLHPVDVQVAVEINGRRVALTASLFSVKGARGHEVPVYLLDADLEENHPDDRRLTGQLYGGDSSYRLQQEALLGLGGIAILRALGYRGLDTYHMNEGHCALLTLALLEEELSHNSHEQDVGAAVERVRSHCVFTTHTPVPAGHDRFTWDLAQSIIGEDRTRLLMQLNCFPEGMLNMTNLGLFLSRYANGVARRHGEVARMMHLGYDIHSITNGVHAATWASQPFADLFDRDIPQWRVDNHHLRQAISIPLDSIEEAHALSKHQLLQEIERRNGINLDPGVLTIGFARRAASYKRAGLVFHDLDRLRRIARERPVQFIFAGKAHPQDEAGKQLIEEVFTASRDLSSEVPVVYLENHDMALGRLLCSGVDVWLNNPRKPLEASGTSGMKAALNGVPSLSVLDGWWIEGWSEGVTGWSIGHGNVDGIEQTQAEAQEIYDKIEKAILPLYYGSENGLGEIRRNAIAFNGSYFSSQRMMEQYLVNAYGLAPVLNH